MPNNYTAPTDKAGSLQFPINKQDKHRAYMLFTPIERIPPSYSVRSGFPRLERLASGDVGGFLFPNNVPPGVASKQSMTQYLDGFSPGKENEKIDSQIALYMPPNIQIQDGVSITPTDLGIMGAAVSSGIQNNQGIIGTALDTIGQAGRSFMDTLKSGNTTGDAANLIMSRVVGSVTGATVTDAVRGTLRTTPNPNSRMIFRNVNLRNFSFDFRMVPTSQEESEIIKKIIKRFREELYPQTIKIQGRKGIEVKAGYKFPNLFDIKFMYNGVDMSKKNSNLKLYPMYLQGLTVNYNSTGGFYETGDFNDVQLTMTFGEERTIDKSDLYDNYGGRENDYYNGYTGALPGGR